MRVLGRARAGPWLEGILSLVVSNAMVVQNLDSQGWQLHDQSRAGPASLSDPRPCSFASWRLCSDDQLRQWLLQRCRADDIKDWFAEQGMSGSWHDLVQHLGSGRQHPVDDLFLLRLLQAVSDVTCWLSLLTFPSNIELMAILLTYCGAHSDPL